MKKVFFLIAISIIAFTSCEEDKGFEGTACFSIENQGDVYIDDEVQFLNCSEGTDYYIWDFGDGEYSTLEEPTHTYTEKGTYTIVLTVQDCEFTDLDADGIVSSYDAKDLEPVSIETTLVVLEK